MQMNGSTSRGDQGEAARPPAPPVSVIRDLKDGGKRFEFSISSDFAQGRVVQEHIIGTVQALKYSDNDLFAIKLALEEALINAIKHGNGMDPGKQVRVESQVKPDSIEIIIQDQGKGFDRASVPDPTLEENLEKNCGRGILLIESYMTEVDWGDNGRRVRMYLKREPELVPKS